MIYSASIVTRILHERRNKLCGSGLSRDFAAAGRTSIAAQAAPTEQGRMSYQAEKTFSPAKCGIKPRMERQMNVKRAMLLVLIGAIMMMAGCGSKYNDLVEVNTEFVSAMEDYIDATGNAATAKDVATAINAYADKIEKLAPQIKNVRGKYPELENTTEVPEELKSIEKKMQELEKKVADSYMNMMKYMMNPEVQKAQQRLSNAMMSMQ